MQTIDLRSDTVTKPCPEMRRLMSEAEVGDDVYGEDPTVRHLEEYSAELLGFESSLFTASGTQANLICLMTHCERGDEYIVGQQAHTYKYEGGGAAVLGSIQPQPIEFEYDGTLDLTKVKNKIKPDDSHFAKSRLLCLENTQNGMALDPVYIKQASEFAKANNLSLHLDGARIFNGLIQQNVEIKDVTKQFDSISVCLSKGLGAPVGSIICGSKQFVQKARRWRKLCGGGMRQAGILAAAGLYALKNNRARLTKDHENAQLLMEELKKLEVFTILNITNQTNMVFLDTKEKILIQLSRYLHEVGILVNPRQPLRLVTHKDVSREDINYVIEKIQNFTQNHRS